MKAGRIADGASGRNGGFCAASLTHGLGNGHERFADELPKGPTGKVLKREIEVPAEVAD